MKNAKRLTLCGMLAAVAVVLSLVERMFPLDAIVPVPGVKLGLANVVTLFALTRLSARDAFAIVGNARCDFLAADGQCVGVPVLAVRRPAVAHRDENPAQSRRQILLTVRRERRRRCGA